MGAGLIDLVAKGVQDLYLIDEPLITFFKVIYRRHTNFSIESIIQNFSSTADFGESVSCTLSRSGDLVGRIFLYVEIPSLPKFVDIRGEEDGIKKVAWVNYLGYALIKEVMIEIGENKIDKQYGEWLYIWSEVSGKMGSSLDKMVGNVSQMYDFSNGKSSYKLFIPLEFWFCRNNGLALPLVALTSTDVKLSVLFRRLEECYRIGPTHSIEISEDIVPFEIGDYIEQTVDNQTIHGYVIGYDYLTKRLYYIKIQNPSAPRRSFEAYSNERRDCMMFGGKLNDIDTYRIYNSVTKEYCNPKPNSKEMVELTQLPHKPKIINSFLYVDFIYLDNEERTKFIKNSHEYLIEQIQFNQEIGVKSPNTKQKLSLNHPCKAHYWVVQLDSLVGPGTINDTFNYTSSHIKHVNRDDRSITSNSIKTANNFVENAKLVISGKSRFKERSWQYFNLIEPYEHHSRGPEIGINVYSPSLHPENFQPSSSLNASKLDSIHMMMKLKNVVNSHNSVKIRSYTINYNILRVYFGLAGMLFA